MEIYPQEIYLGTGRKATGAMAQDVCAAQHSPSTASRATAEPARPCLAEQPGQPSQAKPSARSDRQRFEFHWI